MINGLTIGNLLMDCAQPERARRFYADFLGWTHTTLCDYPALDTGLGIIIAFVQPDIPFKAPIWPEQPGTQQKQMHLDITADDIYAAADRAVALGATQPAEQYGGDYHITLLDTEGHPFCICRRMDGTSPFELYFKRMGYGKIPDLSVNIDCRRSEALRAFYAELTDWDQGFHDTALLPPNRMVVHFMGCEGDFEYAPPAWPDAQGAQQKQMRFVYPVKDIKAAVEEALRAGAARPSTHTDGRFVTLLDTQGHPFCFTQI